MPVFIFLQNEIHPFSNPNFLSAIVNGGSLSILVSFLMSLDMVGVSYGDHLFMLGQVSSSLLETFTET